MVMSPSFECSLDGLASAVRLRYTVWGVADPVAKTAVYMDGYRISESGWEDPEVIRARIELIIGDIERHTAWKDIEANVDRINVASVSEYLTRSH
jgi:hypothetical protein